MSQKTDRKPYRLENCTRYKPHKCGIFPSLLPGSIVWDESTGAVPFLELFGDGGSVYYHAPVRLRLHLSPIYYTRTHAGTTHVLAHCTSTKYGAGKEGNKNGMLTVQTRRLRRLLFRRQQRRAGGIRRPQAKSSTAP